MAKKLAPEDEDDILGLLDEDDIVQDPVEDFSSFKLSSPSVIVDQPPKEIVIEKLTPESFADDFDFIRANLKDIIKSGAQSLERMLIVAQTSEHPRAFEVVATLLKTLADINKDLLDVHKKKKEQEQMVVLAGSAGANGVITGNVTNNTVFVGSTSEIAKLLKDKGMKDITPVDIEED